jgi:thiol-disulfide isomerase/thioredoxin
MAGNMAVLKPAGMRFFVEGQSKFRQEMDHAGKGRLREAMKRFPESEMPYQFMMALAERSSPEEQKLIATELLASPAPESVKALAKHFQEGTRPYQVGQPVDFKFTALDGREVDVQKMKGKVVIIDFWSTTCGPCLAEMPMLKSIYDRFHSQGLEIIGISLDDKETKLRHYLEEKEISWPQFFDGKGWGNKFAVRYGIFGIPTVWLLDRNGVLHTDRARGQLEKMVERLLASPGK